MADDTPSRNDGVTIRACPVCGNGFASSGRRRHCSDACRQAAWRRRHATTTPAPPVLPRGTKRAVTVYICDECDARSLGEQYCADCRTFMRAAGIGDILTCPCCEEPVAVAELMEGGG